MVKKERGIKAMKILQLIILMIITLSVFVACSEENITIPSIPEEPETPEEPEIPVLVEIHNLKWNGNNISFTTHHPLSDDKTVTDSTYVDMYVNMTITALDNSEYYKGWSAGDMAYNHQYSLPLTLNKAYIINIAVENKTSWKDTTFVYTPPVITNTLLKVHFINVQQGDGILIETPDGKKLQIDGGYGRYGGSAWQGGGQPLALTYLTQKNITHLDYIIETHRHLDHYGGLNDIVNSDITYDNYLSPYNNPDDYSPGATLSLYSAVNFIFYNIGIPPSGGSGDNNASIVLKATYGDAQFLFTGDSEGPVQDWLYSQNFDLSVDVLKVANHGADSNNTTNEQFIERTLDQYTKVAILSFGVGNPYNHPRSLNRFRGIETYGTNNVTNPQTGANYHFDCGSIQVHTDGKLIFVTTER